MTINEAIKHCEEVAENCEEQAKQCDSDDRYERHVMHENAKCAADHRQLAEWLKELIEARHYLVKALDGFRALGKYLDDHCKIDLDCDKCPLNNGGNCKAWKHTKAVMKLIGGK